VGKVGNTKVPFKHSLNTDVRIEAHLPSDSQLDSARTTDTHNARTRLRWVGKVGNKKVKVQFKHSPN